MAFHAKDAGSGRPTSLIKTQKDLIRDNRKQDCWILCDEDIYFSDDSLLINFKARIGKTKICFNRMNFEDMVMLHEPWGRLENWISVANQAGHFNAPLTEKSYSRLFEGFFPSYKKRELPFELTQHRFEQALANLQKQYFIRSEFLFEINKLFQNGELQWR